MKTTKTLALAALAALSLGVGTALAQDGGGGSFPDYQSQRVLQQRVLTPPAIPSGSSDVEPAWQGPGHNLTAPEILNHHLYGAGGVAG
jgi:hypothetical protein